MFQLFSVPIHVTNHAFLTWMFFTPLWRAIEKTNRRKWNKNLKIPSFWQYLTVQIVLTERKTCLITSFPQLLKIIENKAWNFESDKGKMSTSNFQERLNWEKARKNTNENNAFCLPFIGCFTLSSQYQILKANTYSILTSDNRTWTASVGVLN